MTNKRFFVLLGLAFIAFILTTWAAVWIETYLSLSETSSGWRKTENRAMLLCHEGSLQADWLDGRRSDPLASSA